MISNTQPSQDNLLLLHLYRGVQICLSSWPTLTHALSSSWISQNKNLNNNPRIASFKKMSSEQLLSTLIKQLQRYILNHQVEPVHLEDWLEGLMDEVFCADVEDCFVKVMAKQLVELVKDLENGNTIKLKEFEEAEQKMKKGTFRIDRLQGNQSDSDEDEEGEYSDEEEEEKEKKPQIKELTQQQKALDDDGWTIVKKKK